MIIFYKVTQFSHLAKSMLANDGGMCSKGLQEIFYQGTRKVDAGYNLSVPGGLDKACLAWFGQEIIKMEEDG